MNSHDFDRRAWFQGLAGLGLASLTGCLHHPPSGGILDTHTHFYDPARSEGVPWPPKDDLVLYRTVLPDEYRRLVSPLGVAGTLVVEASPWVEDNQWILNLIDRHPFLVGLVGHLPVGQPGFDSAWRRYRRNPRFRGIRITGGELAMALQPSPAQDHLDEVSRAGLTLDVLIGPEQLPEVALLADRFRSLRIVVDHCANVPMGPAPHPSPWVSGLAACHYAPNVSMKVSGLVEGTGRTDGTAPRSPAVYRPILDTLWHVLGEDRLLYGSNWPVSSRYAEYATVLGIAGDFFNPLGSSTARKFFRGNAERVYGIALPSHLAS